MTNPEAQRHQEYERWFNGPGVGNAVLRWAIGPTGQWAVSTPLMKVHDHLRMQPHQQWLDVGCGRGSLLRFIDSRVRFERAPVGLDFSTTALGMARHENRARQHTPSLAAGTATALPFADETFDFVTCGYVIKHLTDAELTLFLLEVRRVLIGGGLALIWEFAPSGSDTLDRWNERWLGAHVQAPEFRSTRTLLRAARAAGYELTRNARLRPFLLPPIPRASIFVGKAPEGWRPAEGTVGAALSGAV